MKSSNWGMRMVSAADFWPAMFGSLALVLPFAILQAVYGTVTRQNAPGLVVLFGLLWFLPLALLIVLMSIARSVKTRAGGTFPLALRVVMVAAIVFVWGALLADQMPCFLGVPNCD